MTQPAQQRLRPFSPVRFGRYTLVARLAQGGMGELFLAQLGTSRDFQKLCVIKRMLPQLAHDPEFVERFTNEARVLVKLSHGSIAQVLELGTHEDTPFLALEYVDGKDLRRVAQRARELQRPLPLGVSIQVMSRVLEALSYAHRKRDDDGRELQLVHRDISPPNILVSYEGEVKVIDFGLARSRLSAARTNPRSLLGKFLYMSPEQARHQPLDRRSDLYAVGLCLYELIAGAHPFEGLPPATLMSRVTQPDLPHLSTVAPTCPSGLAEVIMKALAVDPDQRFQSADELRIALQAHLPAADAGAESVSRAMHGLFSAEFQLERRLLAAARSPQQLENHENRSRNETAIISVPAGLQDPREDASAASRSEPSEEPHRTETAIIPAMGEGDAPAPRRDTELVPAVSLPGADSGAAPGAATRPPPSEPARAEPPPMRLAPGSGGALVPATPQRPSPPPAPRPTPEPLPVVSARAAAATFAAPRPPPAPRATTPPPIAPVTAAETAAPQAGSAASASGTAAPEEPTLEPEAEAALAAWFNEVPEGELETEATTAPPVAPPEARTPVKQQEAPTPVPAAAPPPRPPASASPPPPTAPRAPVATTAPSSELPAAAAARPSPAPTPAPKPPVVTPSRPVSRPSSAAALDPSDGMEQARAVRSGGDDFQEAATQQSWVDDDEDEERTDPSFRLTAPEPVAYAFQNRRRRAGLWLTLASLILLGIGGGAALELAQRRQAEEEAQRAAAARREDEENAIAASMARAEAALKAEAEEATAPTWQLFVDTEADAKVLVAPLRLEVQRAARRADSAVAAPPGELGVEWQRTSELFERLRAERTCEGALFLLCKRFERVAERVRNASTDDATLRGQVRELRRSLEQLGS